MKVIRRDDIHPEEFEAGEAQFKIVDLVSKQDGAPVSGGMLEIWKSAPVEFDYDNDCGIGIVVDGSVTIDPNDGAPYELETGDVFYIPQQSGLLVSWHTRDYARVFFVTYPHWR